MKRRIRDIAVLTAVTILAGCSGNSSSGSGSRAEPRYVNGYVGASNVHNALVQAVPINASGQPRTIINDSRAEVYDGERASSTAQAYYRVAVSEQDIGHPMTLITLAKDGQDDGDNQTRIRCQLVAGCGGSWSYGSDAVVDQRLQIAGDSSDTPAYELRASVGNVMEDMRINVNWITHLASAFAYTSYIDQSGNEGTDPTTPRSGIYTDVTIERANLWLNRMFGVADIISSQPLEPYDLRNENDVSTAQLSDAIYYGALVAGAQQLAKDDGLNEVTWLYYLVDDFLTYKGQLYQKGGRGTSLYDIFAAARAVLSSNKAYLEERNYRVPAQTDAVLQRLTAQMARLQDGQLTNVSVRFDEVESWNDVVGTTKRFVADLNERLLNWDASDPDTCPSGTDQNATGCVHSFVDPAYVAKTLAYYDNLNAVYDGAAPGLNAMTQRLRDASLAFIACLNGHASCAGDSAYRAADKTYAVNANGSFRLSVAGVAADGSAGSTEDTYAFDILLPSGELIVPYQTAGGASRQLRAEFAVLRSENDLGETVENKPYVRVVYDQQYAQVPLTAVADAQTGTVPDGYVEPVGFRFSWPYVRIPLDQDGSSGQTAELYFEASLIGVRDVLTLAAGGNSPYHYNLAEIGLQLLALGEDEGKLAEDGGVVTLGDKAELTITGKATNAADYYSDSLWPEADDFFRVREGYEAGASAADLFRYRIQYDESVRFGTDSQNLAVYRMADYIEVEVDGYGINRIEIFADDDVGSAGVRNCSVVVVSGTRRTENCTQVSLTGSVLSVQSLVDDGYLGLFSVPSRGAYAPVFAHDGNGKARLAAEGVEETLDGELKAVFSLGIAELNVRLAQELVECTRSAGCLDNTVSQFSRLPLALVDLNLVRESKDQWEVAITAGYDYDYLVDILPTGLRAQGLYLAYAVGTTGVVDPDSGETINYGFEIADLIVFRGGVTLLGNSSGESIGLTISANAEYAIDENGEQQPCGVINRKELRVNSCEAVGYLTFRNSLIGVIREERDGVYVVRFIDGQFLILGG